MSRYFVILGTMRTGSNLLESTLSQFPGLVCHGEAFNPAFPGRPNRDELLGWSVAARDADPLGFLAHIRATASGRVPGFRLFDGHSEPLLAHVLADPDCIRIVLTRDLLESYVSLQIARATDQWMLRNPARRAATKIWFDAGDFERYRSRIHRFYAGLRRRMQAAGTTAFELDYRDLKAREVLEGLARRLGAGPAPAGLAERIVRQNPGALLEKVENPDDLAAWLGSAPACPPRDPEPAPVAPGLAVLARRAPLIYLPVPGGGESAALAAMARMELHGSGGAQPGGRSAPARRATAGDLFDAGFDRAALIAARPGRQVFTQVRHPAARFHALFLAQVFPGAETTVPWLRQAMAAQFGPLARLTAGSLDLARQRAMFAAFLDMVEAGRAGDGPVHPDWAPQTEILAAWQRIAGIDRLCRMENFTPDMRLLATAAGLSPLPPHVLERLLKEAAAPALPAETVIDAALAARIARLCPEDHAALGYTGFH